MAVNIKGNSTDKNFITALSTRDLNLLADEPFEIGGQNTGFTPMELLGSALTSCTIITLQLYLNRKDWAYEEVDVTVNFDHKIKPVVINREVTVKGVFNEKQTERILAIANACPVHKLLESGNQIITTVKTIV